MGEQPASILPHQLPMFFTNPASTSSVNHQVLEWCSQGELEYLGFVSVLILERLSQTEG